jgi:hypothetical protein
VAEFIYQPTKCRKTYRVVALRKNISRSKGEQVLIDEIRYFFYITTYKASTHTQTQIVELANDRCDQETSTASSSPASAPCTPPSATSTATGPTWSSPHSPGTSSPGTR